MPSTASASPALDEISTLPKSLRARLVSEGYRTGFPAIDQRFVSRDGTVRYLVRFSDAQTVETVWMPDGDGVEETEELLPVRQRPARLLPEELRQPPPAPNRAAPSASPPRPDAP